MTERKPDDLSCPTECGSTRIANARQSKPGEAFVCSVRTPLRRRPSHPLRGDFTGNIGGLNLQAWAHHPHLNADAAIWPGRGAGHRGRRRAVHQRPHRQVTRSDRRKANRTVFAMARDARSQGALSRAPGGQQRLKAAARGRACRPVINSAGRATSSRGG